MLNLRLFVGSALLAFAAFPAAAQMPGAGVVAGTVKDAGGARIPAAAVSAAAQSGEAATRETLTDAQGEFRLTLPVGTWSITISHTSFDTQLIKNVSITPGGTAQLGDVLLPTAQVIERLNVSAMLDALQTTSSTQTATFSSREILSMPTSSRNVTHLIVNQAGVSAPLPDRTGRGLAITTTPGSQTEDASQSLNPSVNGARPTNNALSLNGVDVTNMMNRGGGLGSNVSVPLDALEMVEVQTALYSANTGRNGGGNIQMVTKSGTNDFHGSIYHFFQNEALNANEFFLNRAGTARPRFRRNETGGTFGGPVIKNKTHFFASIQRTDFLSGYASGAIAATGLPTGLTDTRTRDTIAQVANEWLRTGTQDNPNFARNFMNALKAFPADQVPGLVSKFFADSNALAFRQLTAQDIHPVAINILNVKRDGKFLIPSPSAAYPVLYGNGTYGRESLQQQVIPTTFNNWSGSVTVDHSFGSSNRMRLNYSRTNQVVEEAFGWADASPSPTLGDNSGYVASLSDNHIIRPNLINDLRGGFFDLNNTRVSKYRDIYNSSLGIYNPIEAAIGGLASLMPTIDIDTQRNSGGIGNAWDFFDRQRVVNIADNVTWINGRHTVQFGGEGRRINIKGEYMSRTNGDLDYNNWVFFFTGHGAASGSSDLDQGDTRRDFLANDLSWFIQDDWKIRPGLTINAGLRWDYYGNLVEKEGRIGNYYTAETAARMGVQPGFQIPGNSVVFEPGFEPSKIGLVVEPGTQWDLSMVHKSSTNSTLTNDYNNFAPRIGFAWQPRNMKRLVFRGGYGIFYERTSASYKVDLQRAAPFFIYQNVPAPPDMADPYPRLNVNPFAIPLNVRIARNTAGTPRWIREDGTEFPAQSPFNAKNNVFIDPYIRSPYVQQWTFNSQIELSSGNILDLRYVGSRGIGMLAKLNLAQPLDPRVTPVNGFDNIYNSQGALINPDFFVQPQFLGLNRNGGFQVISNWAQSTYHSLQASARGRFARRLSYNLSYTFSKTVDNISGDGDLVEHNAFDLANNRGPSDFDRTHRLTASYVYELPSPLRAGGFGGYVANGWSLSGLVTAQSGTPFSALGNATRNAFFAQASRVRLDFAPGMTIDDARLSGDPQSRLDAYYNVAAFTDSLDRWGNTGRNILRGPSQVQWDFIASKMTNIGERLRTEFRWEIYNAFNTPVFTNPGSTFAANGPGNAGRITSTIGGPRTMQAALRFLF